MIKKSEAREMRKKFAAVKKRTRKETPELIPVIRYDTDVTAYRMKDGGILDIFRVRCKDLTSISNDEIAYDHLILTQFLRKFSADFKIVCINMPENCMEQIQYLDAKIAEEKNAYKRQMQQDKRAELVWLEKNRLQREYYLMTFAANKEEHTNQVNLIIADLIQYKRASVCSKAEKDLLLLKLMNQDIRAFVEEIPQSEEMDAAKTGYDPYLLHYIQPSGGIMFLPDMVRTGNGYQACLTIYDFPATVDTHWMSLITGQPGSIVVIDVATEDQDEVKRNLNRSFREQRIRQRTEREDGDVMNAEDRYEELASLRNAVSRLGEIVKLVTVRVFLHDASRDGLEKKIGPVKKALEASEFSSAVFLNEQKEEWMSILASYHTQQKWINHRLGQPLTSAAVAEGNPFHFSYLSDPNGTYLGQTGSGGSVIFSPFTKTVNRLSYNGLIYGIMGSGKSTLLKKLASVGYALDDFVRVFDPSGEWMQVAGEYGAAVIDLTDKNGMLNQFEIWKTDESEAVSYMRHISKMTTLFRIYAEADPDSETISSFERALRELYVSCGIVRPDGHIEKVTGLPPERYPTMSDWVEHLSRMIKDWQVSEDAAHMELDRLELVRLDRIRNIYIRLISNYGHLFDGHSTVGNVMDHPFVVFNVRSVLKLNPSICNAVLFNALMLCWDNCTSKGMVMKRMYEEKKIAEHQIVHMLVLMDEWWHLINTDNAECLMLMTEMMREMRKYFGGLILASQSVSDNVRTVGTATGKMIKDLLALSTYKFIGLQDSSVLPDIRYAFEGVFTDMELTRIPKLGMGEFILSISNVQTVEFKVFVNEDELELFSGGR